MKKFSKGFSLVELSMVLVIIALLISGVLAGKSLMETAQLKSLIAEVNEYKSAVRQFELNYNGLPGDIKDASDYFSGVANGDGDEIIDSEYINGSGITGSNEPFEAMRQLVSAELVTVNGALTGSWSGGFVFAEAESSGNVPVALEDVYIYIRCCSNSDYTRTISFDNHISLFTINASNISYRSGVITPLAAHSIDSKIDDGIPDYGFVGASGGWSGSNYSTTTPCYTGAGASSAYQITDETYREEKGCQMQFAYNWD